jgi:glycerate 2-kinase
MLSAESFWTSSLRTAPEGVRFARILAASISAVDPGAAVGRFVRRQGTLLTISSRVYDLRLFRRVVMLGLGKASVSMACKLQAILGSRLDIGLVITKHSVAVAHFPFPILEGDHPVPGERSLEMGKKTIALLASLGPEDLLICLISGGGSALVTAPVDGVSLADTQLLTSAMLACGASIEEMNTLRRRLDRIKGGGISKLSKGATIVSLILSDVVGNKLEAIASGPTAPDPTDRSAARSVLEKYKLENDIPCSILNSLETSPETPKPGDRTFEKVFNVIVGSNLQSAQAALKQAEFEGFHPYLLRADMQGPARENAFQLATILRQARRTGDPHPAPACIVAGGETTVTLTGGGKGGRNTELALAAVSELAGFPGVLLATLATDGEDGPTDAAGAVVTGETYHRAARLGLHPGDYLERNDSYSFFSKLDDLIRPGPTGTNVNDLVFLFTF